MTTVTTLQRYQTVCQNLASLYVEAAKMDNAIIQDWDEAYQNATMEGLAYNPASARAKSATRRWTMERNKLQGDIDAGLIELRCMDVLLAHKEVIDDA